jgi:hypothetical protein
VKLQTISHSLHHRVASAKSRGKFGKGDAGAKPPARGMGVSPDNLLFFGTRFVLSLALIFFGVLFIHSTEQVNTARASSFASVGGCPLFPANNIWNRDISSLPVHSNSANFIQSIGITGHLHADFGAGLYDGGPIGIPYAVVPGT